MIRLSAFRSVPPFAQGLVRELRVRWALEEAGLPYEAHLLAPGEQSSEAYRRWQPFGQVPAYAEEGLELFESGALVLHVAERAGAEGGDVLLPADAAGRARTITWMFAALDTVEPPVQALAALDLFHAEEAWAALRRPGAVAEVEERLDVLARVLDGREQLVGGRFTAADLLMTSVLRILRHTELVAKRPALDAYVRRCEARPAFERALAAHLAPFAESAG